MSKEFNIDLAKAYDAKAIHQLMEKVYENLDDKRLFFCDSLDYVKSHIEKEGFAVKVECDGQLVASLIARFPHVAEDNLGLDAGITDLHKVAHLESIVVDMNYRGNGLQDKMIKYAEAVMEEKGYTYLLATVSPDNKYSLANFEKNGFKVVKVKEKYGGLMRAILLKE